MASAASWFFPAKQYPRLFRGYAWALEGAPLERQCDIVAIDGFPRSANPYAVKAVRLLQRCPCRIGNHFDNPTQFALAERYGLPAMPFWREPGGAAVSPAASQTGSVVLALHAYTRVHAPVVRRMRSFQVAPRAEVTWQFARSIARVNVGFGCVFDHCPPDDADDASVRAAIHVKLARIAAARYRRPQATLTSPGAEEAAQQYCLREQYSQALGALRAKAQALYARWIEAARD